MGTSVQYLPVMALLKVSNTESTLPRRRLQTEVSENTSKILRAAAQLRECQIGVIIDELVTDNLANLMDFEALAASQANQEDNNAA